MQRITEQRVNLSLEAPNYTDSLEALRFGKILAKEELIKDRLISTVIELQPLKEAITSTFEGKPQCLV